MGNVRVTEYLPCFYVRINDKELGAINLADLRYF